MNSTPIVSPPSVLAALVGCKCPQCRKGNMFVSRAYDLKRLGDMPEKCAHCGFKFEIEPGFYWGAMYISYAFTVAIAVNVSLILWWYAGNPSIWVYAAANGGLMILLSPLMLRYSRVVMLYLFGSVFFSREAYNQIPEKEQK
jgi:uncharacterized protein (DUF983 family)